MTSESRSWGRVAAKSYAWIISAFLHVLALAMLGMVTWLVARPQEPDRILTLGAAGAGAGSGQPAGDAAGTDSARSESADVTPSDPAAGPPAATNVDALERALSELDALEVAPLNRPGAGDPADGLMQSLMRAADGERAGRGAGAAPGGGNGGFDGYLRGLRGKGLDVVLVLDATDSMTPYIEQAKKRLRKIIQVVKELVPDTRFGAVAYKDYGDDYGVEAVIHTKLTPETKAVGEFINGIVAGGGADFPEPIHEALKVATSIKAMGWRKPRKWVVILVGDSSVHSGGRQEALDLAKVFSGSFRKGTINVIDVGGTGRQGAKRESLQPDLARIAKAGGGSAFLLRDADKFWRHLIISVFDKRFDRDVDVIIDKYIRDK